MPWSVFDAGRDSVLPDALARLAADADRAEVQVDIDRLYANPLNHGLSVWDWEGQDDVPWPSKIVVLGGRVVARYAMVPGYKTPAVIQAAPISDLLKHPLLVLASSAR